MNTLIGNLKELEKTHGSQNAKVECTAPVKNAGHIKGYYKVPGRMLYCETLRQWAASIVLCYVVYKLDPPPKTELDLEMERGRTA